MADDITDPKRKDEPAAPETENKAPAAETPADKGADKPVTESQFTQDPLKAAAGATKAPDDTVKPKRERKPRKKKEAQVEAPAGDGDEAAPEEIAAPAAATVEATAPAAEDKDKPKDDAPKAPEATATAPAPEDKDKPKEAAPAAPQAQTEETPEEKEKREKAEAEAKAKAQAQPQQPADKPLTDDDLRGTKFQTTLNDLGNLPIIFAQKHMPTLNEVWGIGTVDPELIRAIGEDGEIRKHKNGLLFNLPNGHTIEWHHNLGGAEFIGMPRARSKFDEDDAHAVVAASKSRGWQAINVHGTVEQKEMLWLEAQRQGMGVANFQPTQDSPAYQQWLKESTEKPDNVVVGISAAEHGEMQLPKGFELKPAEAIDTPETPKQEAAAPEAKTPEAKAPENKTDAPADQPAAPATPQGEGSFEEFLDRRAAGEKDPNVQKSILAIRDQIKADPTIDTKQVEGLLGKDPDAAAFGKASKFLESSGAGNKTPAVETPVVETKQPAVIEPPVAPVAAKPKAKAAAPATP